MALLEQERAKAKAEALYQEKLHEEEQKINEELEESRKVWCLKISLALLMCVLLSVQRVKCVHVKPQYKTTAIVRWF